ncbi:MAG: hypothetical protein ACRCTE_13985, partial [Cellulosilyticaceae bacterium]
VMEIKNVFTYEIGYHYGLLLTGLLIGMALLVYLQFRDAKNIEVGRFLKALPIQGTKVYGIRVISGIMTYTVPFVLWVLGMLSIRQGHQAWLGDYYSLSSLSELLQKSDSVGKTLGILGITYLVMTAVYMVLVLVQYLVSHRVFALLVGASILMIPGYIGTVVNQFVRGIQDIYLVPVAYGVMDNEWSRAFQNGERTVINYVENIGLKGLILVLIIVLALILGYMSSKYFRVEDQGKLIPTPLVRWLFRVVGTVCIGLLPYFIDAVYGLRGGQQTYMALHIGAIVLTGVGFVIVSKIASIGCKES